MSTTGSAGTTTDDQTNAAERRAKGEFVRGVSAARSLIGSSEFPAETGRYHLYVVFNCPWCHRVAMTRALLGLEDAITMDVLFPGRTMADDERGENLWRFAPEGITAMNKRHVSFPECNSDTGGGDKKYVVDIYTDSGLEQKSVPLLFDKKQQVVVNNESSEIMRMFETEMVKFGKRSLDLYPEPLRGKIDEANEWIYTDLNNGAYKAGFSSDQDVYEAAYAKYFKTIERIETMLADSKFLIGDTVSDSDIRAFATLWRHDPVYHNRMKLNHAFLWEYPRVWAWMGKMMALPGMESVAGGNILKHAKQGYFGRTGNGVVPVGPEGYPECYGKPKACCKL